MHPKRYFMIDFTIASIIICPDKPTKQQLKEPEANKDWKILPFRDITDCYPPQQIIDGRSLPNNWPYPFYLQTLGRLYILCARRSDERKMWIAGFRYVIASTVTVQCIMKHNSKKSESKLKQITEKFHDKHREKSARRGRDSDSKSLSKSHLQSNSLQIEVDRDGNESKLSRKRDRHSKMNDVEELVYQEGTP